MKLKTQFKIGVAFVMFLTLSIGTFFYLFSQRVTNEIGRDRIAEEIFHGVFELNIITNDFTFYPGKRAQQQWKTRQGSLLNLILLAKREFKKKEEVLIVERIRQNQAGIRELFYQLFSILKHPLMGEKRFRSKALQVVITNQIFILSQEMVADSFQLVDLTHARIVQAEKIAIWLVFIFIIAVVGIFIAAFYWMRRKILKPIFSLHKGAEIVAGGDLEYKVDVKSYDEIGELTSAFNTMTSDLHKSQKELKDYATTLELKVKARTEELEASNKEWEAFSYSVSHDLRAPLRNMDGFSQALLEDYAEKIDPQAKDYLTRIRTNSQRMAQLIDDILKLSRTTRAEIIPEKINLSQITTSISVELQKNEQGRKVEFIIQDNISIDGDKNLFYLVFQNLLENAWKFTAKNESSIIEFGTKVHKNKTTYFVRDNGVGFDMNYVDKLFKAFQRLHSTKEFSGTGIGLAIVQRIISRHGGRVWAEGEINKGTTIYFTM